MSKPETAPKPAPLLQHHAQALIKRIASGITSEHGMSSMSASIYDTAWVSMVPRPGIKGPNKWLFPESFAYILAHQTPDGGWDQLGVDEDNGYPEDLKIPDCILHSLAALLALIRHYRDDPHALLENDGEKNTGGSSLTRGLSRISNAKRYLDIKFKKLDLEKTTHFGFELLVPVLLTLLEGEGLPFDFPSKKELMRRYEKASNVDLSWLYNGKCRMPLFSLEGFIGKVGFSRLSHLVTPAGICASPASAAAFLIYWPSWNGWCERYLKHVVKTGSGRGDGSVGGVFPLDIFEASWTLSALLESDFTAEDLGKEDVDIITRALTVRLEDGLAGATQTFFPDADDTARVLTALNYLGYKVRPDKMVKAFESESCFRTFDDRVPASPTSISVNANVLKCLLHSSSPETFTSQIEKLTLFLCERLLEEKMGDPWNISEYYSIMVTSQALTSLLPQPGRNISTAVSFETMFSTVPSRLQPLLNRILDSQNPTGSWSDRNSVEETAYAVIALSRLNHNALAGGEKRRDITIAIGRGKQFLLENWVPGSPEPDRLWTGKSLQGFEILGEAYVLAALKSAA
ncbi:hypothetical protein BDV19DRAFT_385289 [Aspergillus venezuelensis]